jgi:signal transduction histidine kinase
MRFSGPGSLQRQLALSLGALFIAATAIAAGVLVYQAYLAADSISDQDLNRRAADLARFVSVNAAGKAELALPAKLSSAYGSPAETFLFAVRGPEGGVIAASQSEIKDLVLGWPKAGEDASYFRLEGFGRTGQDYYGLTAQFQSIAGPVSVSVARAADADELVHSVLREFVLDIAWFIPLFAAATLAIGILAIRRGLYPLRKISALAADIDPGSLSVRLPKSNLPAEIRPLVQAMNRTLDRLEKGFAVQREFTANAAHELRTPLTMVTAGLDQLSGNGELAKVREDVARMNRLVEQLLGVARLDAVPLDTSGTVDLNRAAADAVAYLAPLAVSHERSLGLQVPEQPVYVKGNRHAIEDALRNLVENALAHTAPHTEVAISVRAAGMISVADRGAGILPDDRVRIFDRFWRGQGNRGSGAGLGLAIVKEIMKAHQGSVQTGDNPGGGAVFTLTFPQRKVDGNAPMIGQVHPLRSKRIGFN